MNDVMRDALSNEAGRMSFPRATVAYDDNSLKLFFRYEHGQYLDLQPLKFNQMIATDFLASTCELSVKKDRKICIILNCVSETWS